MEITTLLPATVAGYLTFQATHYPKGHVGKRLPIIRFKDRIQISPTIQLYLEDKVIHFHHWFSLSLILAVSAFTSFAVLDSLYTRGFLIGAIIQGLTYPDRHIIKRYDSNN